MTINLSKREKAFLTLVEPDGPYLKLKDTVIKIKFIIGSCDLSDDEVNKLGDSGFPGEFANSISIPFSFYMRPTRPLEINDAINFLIEAFEKPSRLSLNPYELAKRGLISENCEQGCERALKETKEWALTSPKLSDDKRTDLLSLVDECNSNFTPIKEFVNTYRTGSNPNMGNIPEGPHPNHLG